MGQAACQVIANPVVLKLTYRREHCFLDQQQKPNIDLSAIYYTYGCYVTNLSRTATEAMANVHATTVHHGNYFVDHALRHTGEFIKENNNNNSFNGYLHDLRLHLSKLLVISGIEQNPGMTKKTGNSASSKAKHAHVRIVDGNKEFVEWTRRSKATQEKLGQSKKGGKSDMTSERSERKTEKFLKGQDRPAEAEEKRAQRRQFTLSNVLERWMTRKSERNQLHDHRERNVPFTAVALARLSHTAPVGEREDSRNYQILIGKFRAQANACQRIRRRIRQLIHKHRATTPGYLAKLRTQYKATVPIWSEDVESFLRLGTLFVRHDERAQVLAKTYLSHRLYQVDDVITFLGEFGNKLGVPKYDGDGEIADKKSHATNYIIKYAHLWLRPYLMSPNGMIPLFFTPTKKIGGIEQLRNNNGQPIGYLATQYNDGVGEKHSDSYTFGPWFFGSYWSQYFDRKRNWIYNNGELITIQKFSRIDNHNYSLIKRILLIIAGIEPNPGWNADLLNISALFGSPGFDHIADFFSSTIFEIVGDQIHASLYLTHQEDTKAINPARLHEHTKYIRHRIVFKNFKKYDGSGEEVNSVLNRGRGDCLSKYGSIMCSVSVAREIITNNIFTQLTPNNIFRAATDIVGTIDDFINGPTLLSFIEEDDIIVDNIINLTKITTMDLKKIHEILVATTGRQKMGATETKKQVIVQASTVLSALCSEGNGLAASVTTGCGDIVPEITISKRMLLMLASPSILTFLNSKIFGIDPPCGCTMVGQISKWTLRTCGLALAIQRTSYSLPFIGSAVLYLSQCQNQREMESVNNQISKATRNALFASFSYLSLKWMMSLSNRIYENRRNPKRISSASAAHATTSPQLTQSTLMQSLLESEKDTLNTNISEELMLSPTNTKRYWDHTLLLSTNASLKPQTRAAIYLLRKFQSEKEQNFSKQDLDVKKYLQQISVLSNAITEEYSMKSFGFYFITFLEKLLLGECWISCEKCTAARTPADFLALQPQLLKHLCLELCGQAQPTVLSTCCLCRTLSSAPKTLSLQQQSSYANSETSMDASKAMTELLKGARTLISQPAWASTSSSNNTMILLQLLSAELSKIMILPSFSLTQSKQSAISLYSSLNSAMFPQQKQESDSEQKPSHTTTNITTLPSSDPSPTPCSNTHAATATASSPTTLTNSSTEKSNTTAELALPKPSSKSEAETISMNARRTLTSKLDCLLKTFMEQVLNGNCPLNKKLKNGREVYHTPYGWNLDSIPIANTPDTTSLPTPSIAQSLTAVFSVEHNEISNNTKHQLARSLATATLTFTRNHPWAAYFFQALGSVLLASDSSFVGVTTRAILYLSSSRCTIWNVCWAGLGISIFTYSGLTSLIFKNIWSLTSLISYIIGHSVHLVGSEVFTMLNIIIRIFNNISFYYCKLGARQSKAMINNSVNSIAGAVLHLSFAI